MTQLSVNEIWVYPVKSMVGGAVESCLINELGIVGDRLWAVRDIDNGGIRGAKKLGGLMKLSAQFVNGSLEGNVPLLLGVTCTSMVLGGLCSWLLDNDNTGTKLSDDVDEPSTRPKNVGGSVKPSPARIGGYTSIANTSTHSPLTKDNDL